MGRNLAPTRGNPFQRRRFASQTKPLQGCHPERSEGSLAEQRSFAALRMTMPDDLFFEMDCPQGFSRVAVMQRQSLCMILFCSLCAFCLPAGKAKCAQTAKNLPGRSRRPCSKAINAGV